MIIAWIGMEWNGMEWNEASILATEFTESHKISRKMRGSVEIKGGHSTVNQERCTGQG